MLLPFSCFHRKSVCLAKNGNKGVLVPDFQELGTCLAPPAPPHGQRSLAEGPAMPLRLGPCQASTAGSRERSCGLACRDCPRGDASTPVRLGPAPRAAGWAGASPGKQTAESAQPGSLISFFYWRVGGNLDCYTEDCTSCSLSIDRIALDRKVNLFCVDKMQH